MKVPSELLGRRLSGVPVVGGSLRFAPERIEIGGDLHPASGHAARPSILLGESRKFYLRTYLLWPGEPTPRTASRIRLLGDEVQGEGSLKQGAVDLLGPVPVKVSQRREASGAGIAQPALQRTASPLVPVASTNRQAPVWLCLYSILLYRWKISTNQPDEERTMVSYCDRSGSNPKSDTHCANSAEWEEPYGESRVRCVKPSYLKQASVNLI